MAYTESQLKIIPKKWPDLIELPKPSLDAVIVEFLKKYEVYASPVTTKTQKKGEAAGTYLKRRQSWKNLKEVMIKTQGANITCYSFRHYYALRCHVRMIDSGSACESMGHSLESHHRNYPYSSKSTTHNAFKAARERQQKI